MAGAATVPQLISRTAEDFLTEFSSRFDGAYVAGEPDAWAEPLGLVINSPWRQRIPIPIDAPEVRRALGDPRFRELYVGELQFEPEPYQDGIEVETDVLEAPDFLASTWADAPGNMAREFKRNVQRLVAALLEANGYLDLYTVRKPGGNTASAIELFSASHKVNLVDSSFGVQSNLVAAGSFTEFNEALLNNVRSHFSAYKAANGNPMGLKADYVLCPTAQAPAAEKFFSRDTVIEEGTAGVVEARNIYQNAVKPIEVVDLTDDYYVYFVCSQIPAYVVQTGGAPEETRWDKDSEFWKRTRKVALSYRQIQGVAGLLPHGIYRVDLKASRP